VKKGTADEIGADGNQLKLTSLEINFIFNKYHTMIGRYGKFKYPTTYLELAEKPRK